MILFYGLLFWLKNHDFRNKFLKIIYKKPKIFKKNISGIQQTFAGQ